MARDKLSFWKLALLLLFLPALGMDCSCDSSNEPTMRDVRSLKDENARLKSQLKILREGASDSSKRLEKIHKGEMRSLKTDIAKLHQEIADEMRENQVLRQRISTRKRIEEGLPRRAQSAVIVMVLMNVLCLSVMVFMAIRYLSLRKFHGMAVVARASAETETTHKETEI